MRIWILIFLFFPLTLFADEEIIVHLTTQEGLKPVYVVPIQATGSGFDQSYINSLEKVIRFDFSNNGKTEVANAQKGASKLEIEVKQKILKAKWSTDRVKAVEGIALSGDLAKDRQTLHRLHDSLFEAQFGTKGVAASHLLYTVRHRKGENSSEWVSDVWESDYDGANAHQLTHEGSLCVTPAFIPAKEGSRCRDFLYVSYKIGQPKIYAAAIGEGISKRVTLLKGNQLMPAISPTLDKIAFISDASGNPDLFIQHYSPETGVIGKPQQLFCAPGAAQGTPSFSPDGKKIAFVSNKDGTPRIYILELTLVGTALKNVQPKMITKKTRDNTSPAWSPDGKKIAYSALSSGVRQIWIYNLLTGEERQLTDGGGHKENPAWGPDSEHLVFNSSSATSAELYLIHINQKSAVKITGGPGEKRFPAWGFL